MSKDEAERLAREQAAARVDEAVAVQAVADEVMAKMVADTVVVGDLRNVGAFRITPGKIEAIPAKDIYVEPPVAAQADTARPTDGQIIGVLATHYHVHESVVVKWILDMFLQTASEDMVTEFMRNKTGQSIKF